MAAESSVRHKALRPGFFIHKSRARKHVPHGYSEKIHSKPEQATKEMYA
jgi:hypothetical protein